MIEGAKICHFGIGPRDAVSLGKDYSEEILKGLPSTEKSAEMVGQFHSLVTQMHSPISHGTLSVYLESIMEKGLGGFFPPHSFSPNRISVCSLGFSDGLIGSYAFAIRRGVFLNTDLSIDARQFDGRDIVQRYVDNLCLGKRESLAAQMKLKFAGALYCLRKWKMDGWPILLIYDTKGEIELKKLKDKITFEKIPSDFAALSPLPIEMLSLMLVPAKRYQEAKQKIADFNLQTPILPLEIIELEEILKVGKGIRDFNSKNARTPFRTKLASTILTNFKI